MPTIHHSFAKQVLHVSACVPSASSLRKPNRMTYNSQQWKSMQPKTRAIPQWRHARTKEPQICGWIARLTRRVRDHRAATVTNWSDGTFSDRYCQSFQLEMICSAHRYMGQTTLGNRRQRLRGCECCCVMSRFYFGGSVGYVTIRLPCHGASAIMSPPIKSA